MANLPHKKIFKFVSMGVSLDAKICTESEAKDFRRQVSFINDIPEEEIAIVEDLDYGQ